MTTSGEKLSHLIGKVRFELSDTLPAPNTLLNITSVDAVNQIAYIGSAAVPLPDPAVGLAYDNPSKVITLTLKSGVTFDANIGALNTDTTLQRVYDVGRGTSNIAFEMTDGTTVTYTPTTNDPDLKADKTIEIKSLDGALTITNPTLADNVSIGLETNKANGLLKLTAAGEIPQSLYDTSVVRLPSNTYNPALGSNPAGVDGQIIRVGAAGNMDVVPIGKTGVVNNYHVLAGDILKYVGGHWELILRSQVDTLAASKINISNFTSTTPFTGNLQKVIKDVADLRVPVSRNLISFDANRLTMNGAVQADLTADVTVALSTNRPNGLAALTGTGLLPMSIMPTASFEFHGGIDASKAIPANRPDGVTPWQSGDTLEVLVEGNPSVTPLSRDGGAATAQAVHKGEIVIWDGSKWIISAAGGSMASGKILTSAGTAGLTNLYSVDVNPPHNKIPPPDLNSLFGALNSNAAFKPADNIFSGQNEFQAQSTFRDIRFGAVGTENTLPTARPTVNGQALVGTTAGTVSWGKVAGSEVSGSITGVSGSDIQTIAQNVYDASIHKVPPTASQRLSGETTINGAGAVTGGAHTVLDTNLGVILGDHSTENQIAGLILGAGTMNAKREVDVVQKVKVSRTAAEVPNTNSLEMGEFAVNLPDKRLFVGDNAGVITELDFKELPTLTNATDHLQIDAAGTGVEWVHTDKVALVDGGVIDVTKAVAAVTQDTVYTVKATATADGSFKELAGETLDKDSKILHTTNGKFVLLDRHEFTAKVEISNTFPSTHPPKVGYLWYKEDEQRLFIRIDNGGNPTWVDAAPARIPLGSLAGTGNRMVYADSNGSLKVDTTGMTTEQKLNLIGVTKADLKTLLGLP